MCYSIKEFFELVPEIPFDLFPVAVYKNLEVSQALTKKRIELISHNQNRAFCVLFLLVLLLAETDPILKEKHGKKNSMSSLSSNSSKIVFILLIKVIALYIELFVVYV